MSTSKIQALVSMLNFQEGNIGGENSFLNTSSQPKFKLAYIEAHKILSVAGDSGLVVGDYVYYAKTAKNGRPYINRMNKVVVELELDDASKALIEEFDAKIKGANQANADYQAQRAVEEPEEEGSF